LWLGTRCLAADKRRWAFLNSMKYLKIDDIKKALTIGHGIS
jgi:hypothetical protein